MSDRHPHPKFARVFRLTPAIGDWTTIKDRPQSPPRVSIRPVSKAGFDCLPKEQLEIAHYVHYRLAELLGHTLSTDLDLKIELHTIKAVQTVYEQFSTDMGDEPFVQTTVAIGSTGFMTLVLDWQLAEQMVDRLSGGSGQVSGANDFTGIEIGMLEFQLEEVIRQLPTAWRQSLFQQDLHLDTSVGTFKRHPKISARESVVVFEMEFSMGGAKTGRLYWEYPTQGLRHLLSQYERVSAHLTPTVALSDDALLTQNVLIRAILGDAQVTMRDLQSLQPGDVIVLNSRIDRPLRLVIGNQADLHIQPGMVNDKLCGQVIMWHDKTGLSSRMTPPITRIPAAHLNTPRHDPLPSPSMQDDSEMGPLMYDHPEDTDPPSPLHHLTNQLRHDLSPATDPSDGWGEAIPAGDVSPLLQADDAVWQASSMDDYDGLPPMMDGHDADPPRRAPGTSLDPYQSVASYPAPDDDDDMPFAMLDHDAETTGVADDPLAFDGDADDPLAFDGDADDPLAFDGDADDPLAFDGDADDPLAFDGDADDPFMQLGDEDDGVSFQHDRTTQPFSMEEDEDPMDSDLDGDFTFDLDDDPRPSMSPPAEDDPFAAWAQSDPYSIEGSDTHVVSSFSYDDDEPLEPRNPHP